MWFSDWDICRTRSGRQYRDPVECELLDHIGAFTLGCQLATPLVELIPEEGDVRLEDPDRFPKCGNRF